MVMGGFEGKKTPNIVGKDVCTLKLDVISLQVGFLVQNSDDVMFFIYIGISHNVHINSFLPLVVSI
jgi:hypothetical protein